MDNSSKNIEEKSEAREVALFKDLKGADVREEASGPETGVTACKIHVKKYISEDKATVEVIINYVIAYKRILITGGMGIGKTYFVSTDLLQYAKSIGKKVVIVIPGVAQLENLNENKNLPIVCGDKSYFDTDIVAVTPDSLLTKVLCKMKPDSYILVVDEGHQKILDCNFRKAFRNIDIAEKNAYRTIYMTATPRVLSNNFDKIIEITTQNPITNKVMYKNLDMDKKDNIDVKLSVIKKALEKYDNIIFFQDNIKINEKMAALLKNGENVTKKVYKDNYQYSICIGGKIDKDYTDKVIWEWTTQTETIHSGKENKDAKEGLLTANVTFVTRVINAGIDLRIKKGNKGILIIDATEKIDIDSFIQLIGRFREGIDVLILTKSHNAKDNDYCYETFQSILKTRINISEMIAKVYNNNKIKLEYFKNDLTTNCLEYNTGTKTYNVDLSLATEKTYSLWNQLLIYNINHFFELLKEQTAFVVNGEIENCSWLEEKLEVGEDIKNYKVIRKEKFTKVKKQMMSFKDNDLLAGVTKKYDKLETSQVNIAKEYHNLKPNSHTDQLRLTGELNIDEEEAAVDIVKAFRYFYSNPWSAIEEKIDARDARLINLELKLNGIENFLKKNLYETRTQKIPMQARIRFGFMETQKKQGRITENSIELITKEMIEEGYFKNKNTKVYLDSTAKDTDSEKAFIKIKHTVENIIEHTYNITVDRRISSVKY